MNNLESKDHLEMNVNLAANNPIPPTQNILEIQENRER